MKSVLIVEGNLNLADHWRRLLETNDVRVIHVATAKAAIECLQSDSSIDVVVTPISLNERTSATDEQGGQLVLTFVSLNLNSPPQVLGIIDGDHTPKDKRAFDLLNSKNVLLKPVPDNALRDKVTQLLNERESASQHKIVALPDLNDELREAVRKAEESERRFRSLADSSAPLTWTTELDSRCSWLSRRWIEYSGRSLEQQIGFGWIETVHPEDQEATKATYLAAFEQQQPFVMSYRLRRYDGVYRWHTVNATPRHDEEGTFVGYVGFSFDDHDARESRMELEASEASLRQVVANLQETRQKLLAVESSQRAMLNLLGSTDGVCDWSVGTDEVEFAPGFRQLIGYEGDDVDGFSNSWRAFLERIHPDDSDAFRDVISERLHQRLPFEHEYRIRRKDESYIWVRTRGTASYDSLGKPERLIGSTHSIEAQKVAEQSMRNVNIELKRANLDLEQFAYVASHDLQEPLRAIFGFAQLLRDRYQEHLDSRGQGYIEHVITGVSRMQQLINDLLHFSRISGEEVLFHDVELSECIAEAIERLGETIRDSKAVVAVGSMPQLKGHHSQLIQLFQNLIGNAIKYQTDRTPNVRIQAVQEGDVWAISVEDNGIGIAEEHQLQIFSLFKRLHRREEYPGTGIGLAICQRVVDGHHGSISLTSSVGTGSCFTVRLPTGPTERSPEER